MISAGLGVCQRSAQLRHALIQVHIHGGHSCLLLVMIKNIIDALYGLCEGIEDRGEIDILAHIAVEGLCFLHHLADHRVLVNIFPDRRGERSFVQKRQRIGILFRLRAYGFA